MGHTHEILLPGTRVHALRWRLSQQLSQQYRIGSKCTFFFTLLKRG